MNSTELTNQTTLIGGTSKFSIVLIEEDYFIENNQDISENLPRLPIGNILVSIYINQLESYLDSDPDHSEEERIYNENLFNEMCEEYFATGY